jgi:deoxyribodipyrimidine photo-lyase
MQFLIDALSKLAADISARGSRLLVIRGKSIDVVPRLAQRWKADRVVAQRWVEPFARERDRRIGDQLGADRFQLFEGETLLPPGSLRTAAGAPYAVFSPFARAFRAALLDAGGSPAPSPAPRTLPPLPADIAGADGSTPDLDLAPIPSCGDLGIVRNPAVIPGSAADARLRAFVDHAAMTYADRRDRMDLPGTSRLSADLKFGTLSVARVWATIDRALGGTEGARAFENELLWREFAHSTLWDRPRLLKEPFSPAFVGFPWRDDTTSSSDWQAWVEGRTGYPVVDAAARQLLGEGFVHNRARMVSASFLTKHLLIDYRRGEAHYMQYLVDGDWANNNMGWQWSAGCGCDAQPYFRVFNPVTQGQKFDPNGDYVRRWVPELARLPARYIHRPWEAPSDVLARAGVALDRDYPRPIVDHRFARERFLALANEHTRGRRFTAADASARH